MKFKDIKMLTEAGSYEINTSLDLLIETINRYEDEYGLVLNPAFQRGHIWTEAQQIAYVEFFLRGGMTGRTIYFNKANWGHFTPVRKGGYDEMVLVDGLQRLTALMKFVNGEIPAFGYYSFSKKALAGNIPLDSKPHFEDNVRMSSANYNLRININNLKTHRDVLNWYLELNSGGTPHTQAELDKVRGMIEEEK